MGATGETGGDVAGRGATPHCGHRPQVKGGGVCLGRDGQTGSRGGLLDHQLHAAPALPRGHGALAQWEQVLAPRP